jgi:hypothetical protein
MTRLMGRAEGLAEFLALLLDFPVAWVRRFYCLSGAVQVVTEFLMTVDPMEGAENMKADKKAMAILKKAGYHYGR